MKTIFVKLIGTTFLISSLLFSACKKSENNGPDFNLGNSEMSMKIDGTPWKAQMAILASTPIEETEEDYYFVALVGSEVELDEGDDVKDTKGLTIYLAIPKAKFKNPKGTYSFTGIDEVNEEFPAFAYLMQSGSTNEGLKMYSTATTEVSAGSVTINNFKTGKQSMFGIQISEYDSYTQMSGTFSMTLTEAVGEGETARVLQITDGKFDVDNSFGLSGLFGQFSDMKEKLQLK